MDGPVLTCVVQTSCEIGNGHARCNCHRDYSVLRTATCLVASHDDPGLHVWRSGTKKKARAVLAISWRFSKIQGREKHCVEQGGWSRSRTKTLDLMRRQHGGELGRRMKFVTSINPDTTL